MSVMSIELVYYGVPKIRLIAPLLFGISGDKEFIVLEINYGRVKGLLEVLTGKCLKTFE